MVTSSRPFALSFLRAPRSHRHDHYPLPLRRYDVDRRQFIGCESSTLSTSAELLAPRASAAPIDGNRSGDSAIVSPARLTIRQRQVGSFGVLNAATCIGTASRFRERSASHRRPSETTRYAKDASPRWGATRSTSDR